MQEIIRSLFRGIALSLMFVFVGVSIATRNWILGLYAAINTFLVVCLNFGIVAFSSWSLGVIESVVMILIVPLSSIVSIIIALSFDVAAHTGASSRKDIVKMCMTAVGPTVLTGILVFFPSI